MADGYALALQKGLIAALRADSAVAALVSTRIYDEPPANATLPYARFDQISPDAFDTDNTEGASVSVGIHVHSEPASGRVEAVQVAEAIKNALHRQESSVTVTGFTLVELIFQTYTATRNSEGRGWTARIALQAMLETA